MRNKILQNASRVARNSLERIDKSSNLSDAIKQANQLSYRLNFTLWEGNSELPKTTEIDGALMRMMSSVESDIKNKKENPTASSKVDENIRAKAASVRMLHKSTEDSFVKKVFGSDREDYERSSQSYINNLRQDKACRDR